MLVAYADDASLLAVITSPGMSSMILNSLVAMISEWCTLWGMKMNPNKARSMTVSRSRALQPQHDLLIDNVPLHTSDS